MKRRLRLLSNPDTWRSGGDLFHRQTASILPIMRCVGLVPPPLLRIFDTINPHLITDVLLQWGDRSNRKQEICTSLRI